MTIGFGACLLVVGRDVRVREDKALAHATGIRRFIQRLLPSLKAPPRQSKASVPELNPSLETLSSKQPEALKARPFFKA